MGSNYNGPAKHVTTLTGVLEETTSLQVRKWKMPELDHLYNVASGMLAGATGGELLQLQNSIREIVARKSDIQTRPLRWLAAVSAIAALGTFGLRLADQGKIRSLEARVGHLESATHAHKMSPPTPPNTPKATTDPLRDTSVHPNKNQ
jgi:hypothetical protein